MLKGINDLQLAAAKVTILASIQIRTNYDAAMSFLSSQLDEATSLMNATAVRG